MTSFLALRASVCAYLWCLIPPVFYYYLLFFYFYGMLYRLPAGVPSHYLKRSLTGSLSGIGRSPVRNLLRSTLILFFLTWAGPILLQVPPRFDPAFSGSRLVRVSFSSWDFMTERKSSTKREQKRASLFFTTGTSSIVTVTHRRKNPICTSALARALRTTSASGCAAPP